jgi:hypothetical protein
MTRSQFRFLVVANQLLLLATIVVQQITDRWLPPELRAYFGIDESVLNVQITSITPFSDVPYWVGIVLIVTGVIGSIGMCFGKRWGRTLYLLTFIASLGSTLLTPFYLNTGTTVFVSYLVGTTEGMILGLAYFSHIRRLFVPAEELS